MNPDTYQVWPSLTGFLVLQRELAFAHNFSENTNISIGQGFHKKPWEHYDVANRLHLPQKQILLRWLTKEAGDYKVSMSMDEMWNLTLNQLCLIDWVRKSYTWIWFLMHSSDCGSRNNHLYNVLITQVYRQSILYFLLWLYASMYIIYTSRQHIKTGVNHASLSIGSAQCLGLWLSVSEGALPYMTCWQLIHNIIGPQFFKYGQV